ncbi:MAG: DUF819 family protein [Cryomorphaceae bacterium]|nr:DUF819 family protein [Cryomorphaceae bacterium]
MFPLTNDAVVLGLLMATLAIIFYSSHHPKTKKFYKYVPTLLMCYFVPAIYNSAGIVDGEASALYPVASNYLLPASLVLLCLSIDLKGIIGLGPKALIMFFTATIGIVVGGPVALLIVGAIQPSIMAPEVTLAGELSPSRLNHITLQSGNSIAGDDVLLMPDGEKFKVDTIYEYSVDATTHTSVVDLSPVNLDFTSTYPDGTLLTNMNSEFWRGLSTVCGSWIGGGANQTALKEISDTPETQFSAMLIVDIFVANIWMAFLLVGAGMSVVMDRKLKADSSSIDALKKKIEDYNEGIARIPSFTDISIIIGIAFGGVAIAHLVADFASTYFHDTFAAILKANPDSLVIYLSSIEKSFFWIVIVATIVGILFSFTKARNYEGAGASKIGSMLLYVLVATIGMKINIVRLIEDWDKYWAVILIGIIWMLVHITILLIVAKLVKAPFFFVAVGSQANVGGAASAPIVASAFSPALAPVGVLLAILGYAVGTIGAIVGMELMHALYL